MYAPHSKFKYCQDKQIIVLKPIYKYAYAVYVHYIEMVLNILYNTSYRYGLKHRGKPL